jgi:S-DNA-T family DNA segregation ATPase FtsK/SpoIIIE
MATSSRNLTRKGSILPPSVTAFLLKRSIEAIGVALIITALAIIAALVSFNPADPSLNAASGAAAENLLGQTGAWAADLLMQSIGLAAWLLHIADSAICGCALRSCQLPC